MHVHELPSVDKIRQECLTDSVARNRLKSLFDTDTFVEIGAYTKRSFCEFFSTEKTEEFEGVICGYGAINGSRVFAFAQDPSRMKGAIDAQHAKKICDLYDLAIKTGAPVIAIFDSAGTDVFEGVTALSGYASIMRTVSEASGIIPQIAIIGGLCLGSLAALAAMYDFTITPKGTSLYVTSPSLLDKKHEEWKSISAEQTESFEDALNEARRLIDFLPANSSEILYPEESADDLNRMLADFDCNSDAHNILSAISDNYLYLEVGSSFAPEYITALTCIGGIKCGVCASSYSVDEGRLSSVAARKIARFISVCDAFGIPLVTLTNSAGLSKTDAAENLSFASDLANLATSYANASVPKVTLILGHAIGASYVLLGSKALGADIAYALDVSEIGALAAEDAVAFAWSNKITVDTTKESLSDAWKATIASPVSAASTGEIDDIISVHEIRQRICTSLHLLVSKGAVTSYRHTVRPL